ncbi:DMT family transporter [Nocardioides sp. BGMRC 2183]|nr:DMT family transporter [Nocardioides sp. BGMRC 2183]
MVDVHTSRTLASAGPRAPRSSGAVDALALGGGALAMAFVGGSVAVSGVLRTAPMLSAQSLRYALAGLLLLGFARWSGRTVRMPRGTDWLWLAGVVLTGLVLFNIALVHGSAHAEPAVLAVAMACVPLVLAVAGPLTEGRRPETQVIVAAVAVTLGAAIVQGWGRSDLVGFGWAVVVLVCEAGFTLFAVPVLRRHSPVAVSVHTTLLAALVFAVLALPIEGPVALTELRPGHLVATVYLAVAVTAVAFVLWYGCVERVGSGRAGLLMGVSPVAAVAVGAAITGQVPGVAVWLGIGVVAGGLAFGLRASDARAIDPLPETAP